MKKNWHKAEDTWKKVRRFQNRGVGFSNPRPACGRTEGSGQKNLRGGSMQKVTIKVQDEVAIVRLTNGVTNAISPELVSDLGAAVDQVKKECRGMVLAGGSKFFSIGFDLPSLLPLDRDGVLDFFVNFNRVILAAYTLPMPTVCAVAGHAVGGGNIIALAGDYRYMAEGKKRIGLNEINLGVPVPYLADMILRQVVGDRAATEMLFGGELMPVDEAARIGLVDAVLPEGELEQLALEKVTALAGRPDSGFAAIKDNRVETVQRRYEQNGLEKDKKFVGCWFLPEVQELLKKAAEKF
jgi:Delta3-Delta2-enoyl-CoA isomerase